MNDLLCSSQASLIALFTHTTHVDSIRMSVVACRVNLFTHTAHVDNVSSSLQSENVTYCSCVARGCVSLQSKKHTEVIYTMYTVFALIYGAAKIIVLVTVLR